MTGQNSYKAEHTTRPIGTCATCGRFSYTSRKNAKRAAKRQRATTEVSAYKCGDAWHAGRPPQARAVND